MRRLIYCSNVGKLSFVKKNFQNFCNKSTFTWVKDLNTAGSDEPFLMFSYILHHTSSWRDALLSGTSAIEREEISHFSHWDAPSLDPSNTTSDFSKHQSVSSPDGWSQKAKLAHIIKLYRKQGLQRGNLELALIIHFGSQHVVICFWYWTWRTLSSHQRLLTYTRKQILQS